MNLQRSLKPSHKNQTNQTRLRIKATQYNDMTVSLFFYMLVTKPRIRASCNFGLKSLLTDRSNTFWRQQLGCFEESISDLLWHHQAFSLHPYIIYFVLFTFTVTVTFLPLLCFKFIYFFFPDMSILSPISKSLRQLLHFHKLKENQDISYWHVYIYLWTPTM